MRRISAKRPSPAMVVAVISLFVALGGSAAALSGSNTVFSDDIVAQNVKGSDIKPGAVGNGKLAPDAVTTGKILDGQVMPNDIQPNSLTGVQILEESLSATPGIQRVFHLTLNPGAANTLITSEQAGGVKVTYSCPNPTSNTGSLIFDNETASTFGLWIDNGGSNPTFVSLAADGAGGQTHTETTTPAGERITVFAEAPGPRWINIYSRHGTGFCVARSLRTVLTGYQ